jgi:hypothetical protein
VTQYKPKNLQRSTISGCLILALLLLAEHAFAAEKSKTPTAGEVLRLVREAKILSPDLEVNAEVNGAEINISTYLNPKANDNDCKIDAVLIAKKLFDSYQPDSFADVKVCFYETTDPSRSMYRTVIVRTGDLEVFSKNAITKEALLASITVAHERRGGRASMSQSVLNSQIKSGLHKEDRQNLLNMIRELQAKNQDLHARVADVDKCCELFARSEAAAQKGDPASFLRAYNDTIIAVNQEQVRVNQAIAVLNQNRPKKGPQYERRMTIYTKLSHLEERGVDVSQLRRIFDNEVEPRAKTGQDSIELDASLSTLERALNKFQ